ncbi:MAG: GMC family oxidoreductase [Thermomicrobiales bacterium]
MASVFDVVIVGAGPAGCVLANRLSEDPERRILLIEAGPDYGDDISNWPPQLLASNSVVLDSHLWGYANTDPEIELTRARIVGGTSTVNGCLWIRGSAADYDAWAALGNPGWSFDEMLPWFRKAESDPMGGELHGHHGPVPVSRTPDDHLTELDRGFQTAAERLGVPACSDLNGTPWQEPGVGPPPTNSMDGVRMNAAFTYLRPARDRSNLTVMPDTLIDRVNFEGNTAVGVVTADGRQIAGRDVVLCSGSYGSPSILLRSGIGPAEQMNSLGIPLVVDSPGVGENLFDHPLVNGLLECDVYSGYQGSGPTFAPVIVKMRSSVIDSEIDYHIYQGQGFNHETQRWTLWFSVTLQYARSRGRLRLKSRDPHALASIDHAYFSDADDLEALCDGVEFVNRLARTEPLSELIEPNPAHSLTWTSREELRQNVRAQVGTTYHPSGTCKMGPVSDPMAVVDARGQVYGVQGLRVVDASIFPTGPHGNLHFPTVAAAEKIAAGMMS